MPVIALIVVGVLVAVGFLHAVDADVADFPAFYKWYYYTYKFGPISA